MILLEAGNLDGLVIIFAVVMFGPAILLAIIGFALRRKQHTKASKIFFILAVLYLVISLGICGGLMA